MRHKLQKEKVIDIVNTANYSGFAPSFLLANHDNKQLMEAAENAAGERKNAVVRFLMSFSNGFSNWIRGKSERNRFLAAGARIGAKKATTADITDLMADPTSIYLTPEQVQKTNTDRLEDYAALSDWLAGWQESAASATYSHLRPVENAVLKIITEAIENGGSTLESGVVSTLAYAFGGPLGGLAARFYNTSAESETEAGHVYMEAFRRGL